MAAGCSGGSPCVTCPGTSTSIVPIVTSTSSTSTTIAPQTTAHYLGAVVSGGSAAPSQLDLSVFFGLPSGSTSGVRALLARPAAVYPVNGGFTFGSGSGAFSGSLTGSVNGDPTSGVFTGVLNTLVNGCGASRFYSGPLTNNSISWAAGNNIDTCGGASPLTFAVAASATAAPATIGTTIPTTIPAVTTTSSTSTTTTSASSTSSTTTSTISALLASIAVDNAPCVVPSSGASVSCGFRGVASGGLAPYTYAWTFTGTPLLPGLPPAQVTATGQVASPVLSYCTFRTQTVVQLTITAANGAQASAGLTQGITHQYTSVCIS